MFDSRVLISQALQATGRLGHDGSMIPRVIVPATQDSLPNTDLGARTDPDPHHLLRRPHA